MEQSASVRWRIRFSGSVQHVGFRYMAYYFARSLCLTGWVDNLPDGSVLMEVQGSVTQIRKLLVQLKSQPHLHITDLQITEIEKVPFERRFSVRGH